MNAERGIDTEAVNRIVDKVSEKIGVAVETIKPLALETIHQVVLRAEVWLSLSITGFVLSLAVCLVTAWKCNQLPPKSCSDDYAGYVIIIIASLVFAVSSFIAIVVNAGVAVAPLPSILGI